MNKGKQIFCFLVQFVLMFDLPKSGGPKSLSLKETNADGTTTTTSSPVQIGSLTDWASIDAGGLGGSAVKTDGTLWSWGQASNGRLGDGTTTNKSSPVQVGSLTDWILQSSAGGGADYGIKSA